MAEALVKNFINAATVGDEKTLRRCLEDGVDVNSTDGDGYSAVSLAGLSGKIDLMRLLLSYGANVDLPNNNGNSPLHSAALYNKAEMAGFLVDQQADIFALNRTGMMPFAVAEANDAREVLKILSLIYEQQHWKKIGEGQISMTRLFAGIQQKRTEVFDFQDRLWTVTMQNVKTMAESTVVKEFSEVKEPELLEIAAGILRERGGKVDENFLKRDHRVKQSLVVQKGATILGNKTGGVL